MLLRDLLSVRTVDRQNRPYQREANTFTESNRVLSQGPAEDGQPLAR